MRLIVRKERPHPGAQLRFTDRDGLRLTAFVTNITRGQLPDLELRHRHRAHCEDRIRAAKDTGLRNLPFHSFDANRIWIALVALALDLTAWMQTLALHDYDARRWEPKTLRLRLFSAAGRIARHARTTRLHLARHALPPPPRRGHLRRVLDSLEWVRAAVNVYALLSGNDAASSAVKTITELAARALAAIVGLGN